MILYPYNTCQIIFNCIPKGVVSIENVFLHSANNCLTIMYEELSFGDTAHFIFYIDG